MRSRMKQDESVHSMPKRRMNNHHRNLVLPLKTASLLLLFSLCACAEIELRGSLVSIKLGLSRDERAGACVEIQSRCGHLGQNAEQKKIIVPAPLVSDQVSVFYEATEQQLAGAESIVAQVFLAEDPSCSSSKKTAKNRIVLKYIAYPDSDEDSEKKTRSLSACPATPPKPPATPQGQ